MLILYVVNVKYKWEEMMFLEIVDIYFFYLLDIRKNIRLRIGGL